MACACLAAEAVGPRRLQGPRQQANRAPYDKDYLQSCQDHYRPFWKLGVPVDIIETLSPFDRYKLVVAPMLFML